MADRQRSGHARWVRLTHWMAAVSVAALTFSGVEILMVHPRLYWGEAGNDLQENGNRADARWLRIGDLRIEGEPVFDFTARRWTSEDLDAARHTDDLKPREQVYLNLDLAQHGLGTASCGPGVLPQYRLHAQKATFAVTFATA